MTLDISPSGRRVGKRMRSAWLERNITQEEVGFKVGLSASYLCQFERGGRGLMLEKVVKIVRALKIDPSELTKGIYRAEPTIMMSRTPGVEWLA